MEVQHFLHTIGSNPPQEKVNCTKIGQKVANLEVLLFL